MNAKQTIPLCFLAWCTLAVAPTFAQTITHVPRSNVAIFGPSTGEEFGSQSW